MRFAFTSTQRQPSVEGAISPVGLLEIEQRD
jgi:hypothetical protein